MKILYYSWELSDKDIPQSLSQLGHTVTTLPSAGWKGPESEELYQAILDRLANGFDAVFTMNFFPAIARACQEKGVLYLSWIWDCPHLTLYSKTAGYSCNRIFSFDLIQTQELLKRRVQAKYLPLAVNTDRLSTLIGASQQREEEYQVSFVGSLKQEEGEEGILGRIRDMPEDLRGYIDGIVEAQLLIYGYDLIGECLSREKLLQLVRLAPITDPEDYETDKPGVYADWIRKKCTILERKRLLTEVASRFSLALASPQDPGISGVQYLGLVDYATKMPLVFARSRINLNLTMRTIRHGIPLRVLDVLGAGGFLITNYQPDFDNYFTNGKELVWFESKEQLLELIDYYLRNEEERDRIAKEGQRRAAQIFNYPSILKELFSQI